MARNRGGDFPVIVGLDSAGELAAELLFSTRISETASESFQCCFFPWAVQQAGWWDEGPTGPRWRWRRDARQCWRGLSLPAPQAQICAPGWCRGSTSLLPKPVAPFSPFPRSIYPHLGPSIGLLRAFSHSFLGMCCLQPCAESQHGGRAVSPLPLLSAALSLQF